MKDKKSELTAKQDKFCREYLLTGNQSEAFRRAYDAKKMKPETIWSKASILMRNDKVKARIESLKGDLEHLLGITKATEVKELMRIRQRCLKPEPKMVWVKNARGKMEQVQEEDEEGNLVWQFDSNGANSAQDKILKAMGYYAPEKKDITSGGEPLTKIIEVD